MRIALVHDYLTQSGGAERVLEALHGIWPDAPVFTSLYDPAAFPPHWRGWDVRESALGRIPGARHNHRLLLPLYPLAFASFRRELAGYDVVLSDSSAWAHQAGDRAQVRISYCHSPSRFLWGDESYLQPARIPPAVRRAMDIGFGALRRRSELWWPALLFLVAWFGNAAVVALAAPVHDRYGARLVWLAPLLALLLALRVAVAPADVQEQVGAEGA